MKSETHTFNLSKNVFSRLEKYAKNKEVSMSAVLRMLINEHCEENNR